MKNPYLELFFKLMDKDQQQTVFNSSENLNLFDFVTLINRFMNTKDMMVRIDELI